MPGPHHIGELDSSGLASAGTRPSTPWGGAVRGGGGVPCRSFPAQVQETLTGDRWWGGGASFLGLRDAVHSRHSQALSLQDRSPCSRPCVGRTESFWGRGGDSAPASLWLLGLAGDLQCPRHVDVSPVSE